jgi:hypothetical protein
MMSCTCPAASAARALLQVPDLGQPFLVVGRQLLSLRAQLIIQGEAPAIVTSELASVLSAEIKGSTALMPSVKAA